jgi:hypothetical protein
MVFLQNEHCTDLCVLYDYDYDFVRYTKAGVPN